MHALNYLSRLMVTAGYGTVAATNHDLAVDMMPAYLAVVFAVTAWDWSTS